MKYKKGGAWIIPNFKFWFQVVEKYLEDEELESFDIYPSGWTICKDILHDSFQ